MDKEVLGLMISARENARGDAQLAVSPQLEHLHMNYEASIKYADQAIRSGFLLNGGALVLFSGYAAVFKINPNLTAIPIVASTMAFVLGLTASSLCSYFAHRSARFAMLVANNRIAGTLIIPLLKTDDKEKTIEHPLVKAQYDSAAVFERHERHYTKLAVVAGLSSLGAFVIGTLIAGWTLISHAGT